MIVVTLTLKHTLRNVCYEDFIQQKAVFVPIAISGDYMIKVKDRSTSTTTLIRLRTNLSPK